MDNTRMTLEEELKYLQTLSLVELEEKKFEFLNSKQLISYELDMAKIDGRVETKWYIKARQAYQIFNIKLDAINTLIKRSHESHYRKYKSFYTAAISYLPSKEIEKIETEASKIDKAVPLWK